MTVAAHAATNNNTKTHKSTSVPSILGPAHGKRFLQTSKAFQGQRIRQRSNTFHLGLVAVRLNSRTYQMRQTRCSRRQEFSDAPANDVLILGIVAEHVLLPHPLSPSFSFHLSFSLSLSLSISAFLFLSFSISLSISISRVLSLALSLCPLPPCYSSSVFSVYPSFSAFILLLIFCVHILLPFPLSLLCFFSLSRSHSLVLALYSVVAL